MKLSVSASFGLLHSIKMKSEGMEMIHVLSKLILRFDPSSLLFLTLYCLASVSGVSTKSAEAYAQQLIWQQTSGPIGGSIHAIAVNPSGYIFAGVWAGGIFRSMDNGSSWESIGDPQISITGLVINTSGDIFAIGSGKVLRSIDNGDSWQQAHEGIHSNQVSVLFIQKNGDIFAGTQGSGVYRSIDNGSSWIAPSGFGLTNTFCRSFASFPDRVLLLATGDGIFKSSDNGEHWTHAGLKGINVGQIVVANDSCIFAGHSSLSLNDTCIYKSLDRGNTWTKSDSGITVKTIRSLFQTTNGYLYAGTSSGGVFRSTNSGQSWAETNTGLKNKNIRSFAVDSTLRLLAGTNFGVAASSDAGENWTHIGVPHSQVYSLSISEKDDIYASTNYGVSRSSDNGKTWYSTSLSHPTVLACFTIKSIEYVFAGGTYYSTNRGEQWHQINSGLSGNVRSFACDSDGRVYAGTDNGIFRLNEDFNLWSATGLNGFMVNSIAINHNNGMLFAGTERPRPYSHNGVFRSTDGGLNWVQVLDDTTISCLLIHPNGCIIAATKSLDSRTYRSTDNGDSWEIITNGLQGNILSLEKNSSGYTFASSPVGVFRSTDYGDSWTNVSFGLPALTIVDLSVNSTGLLFAGTYGNGVYRTESTTVSVEESGSRMPVFFLLYQNYPNPFNSSTIIKYHLQIKSKVKLTIYDINGKEIKTLINQDQNAGQYSVDFDAGNLASGIYIYRLKSNLFEQNRKMILLR